MFNTGHLHKVFTFCINLCSPLQMDGDTMILSLTKVKMLPQVSLTRLMKVRWSVDNSQIILCVTVVDSFSFFFFLKFGGKKKKTRANVGHGY